MANKQPKQLNEETTTVAADIAIVQKSSNDEVVKVKLENLIPDNTIDSDKLLAAQMDTPTSTGDLSTTYVTTANLTLGAGTWLLLSVGNGVFSVAQFTIITGRFYNTTDATEIVTQTFAASYVSGTISARPAVSMAYIVTLTGTKQIDAQYKLDTGAGSASVSANLIAVPVGV